MGRTDKEVVGEMMKRVEANDAFATFALGNQYFEGQLGLLQDEEKAMQLWTQAAELGFSHAHFNLGAYYHKGGDSKKEKFHYEAAAMAGHEVARYNLGCVEEKSRNMVRAIKHWKLAASAGHHKAMNALLGAFKGGVVSRDEIESTLTAYNKSCAEMRSEARDTFIRMTADRIGGR
jgi:TPR repeat protein